MSSTQPTGGKLSFLTLAGSVLGAVYYLFGVTIYLYKGISIFGANPHTWIITGVAIFFISMALGIVLIVRAPESVNGNRGLKTI